MLRVAPIFINTKKLKVVYDAYMNLSLIAIAWILFAFASLSFSVVEVNLVYVVELIPPLMMW